MDIVKIEGLEKSYGDFRLGPFDLRVEAGAILGILGHPGAGKTTLLRMLWGFDRPDKGRVEIFGVQPHLNQLHVRTKAGYAAEFTWYYPELTVEHFLNFIATFYDNWDEAYIRALLKQFGIQYWHQIKELSLPGRRKLAMIAAMGHHPPLLMLDQPTAGLDEGSRTSVLKFLRKLSREEKVTLVVSSHISDDLDRITDGVLVINHGHVLESTC
jgi:ABC-2 type transport system ATP-binding protein